MARWTADQTMKLIEEYERYPELWNVGMTEYRNREKKAAALKQIAETLGMPEKEVGRKWRKSSRL